MRLGERETERGRGREKEEGGERESETGGKRDREREGERREGERETRGHLFPCAVAVVT